MPFTCSKHGEIKPEPNKAQCPMCALESAQNRKRAECCYHCTHARNVKWTSWCECQLLIDAKVEEPCETEVYYHEICSNFEFRPEGEMMPLCVQNPEKETDDDLMRLNSSAIEPLLAEDWNSPEDKVWDTL
jgi:hypothetical protein